MAYQIDPALVYGMVFEITHVHIIKCQSYSRMSCQRTEYAIPPTSTCENPEFCFIVLRYSGFKPQMKTLFELLLVAHNYITEALQQIQ